VDRVQTPVAADLDFEHAPNSALRNCLTRRELNYEEYGVIEMQKQMAAQVINTTSQGLQYIKEENERLVQLSGRQLQLIQEERDFLNGNHYEFVLPHDTPGGRMPPQDRQDVADSSPGNEAEVSSNVVNYSGKSITDEDEDVVELASSVANMVVDSPVKQRKKKGVAPKKMIKARDLTTLTDSALERKVRKPELVAFLHSKGVNTVGDNGKILKNKDLVEAVLSLKRNKG